MAKVEITLKNRRVVTADIDEFKVAPSLAGVIGRLSWTTPAAAERVLMWVDTSDISAIVYVHEEGDSEQPQEAEEGRDTSDAAGHAQDAG